MANRATREDYQQLYVQAMKASCDAFKGKVMEHSDLLISSSTTTGIVRFLQLICMLFDEVEHFHTRFCTIGGESTPN
jgi:hypothetical protein